MSEVNKRPKLPKNRPLRDSAPDFTRGRRTLNRALSLVSDVIDLVDVPIPGKNLLSTLVNDAIERRRATARDELLRAISEGVTQPETAIIEQIDEFVAIGMRYEKAAMDGVRRQNLRLLARIVATQLEGRSANFEDFAEKASAIEQLTDAELNLLGWWFANGAGKDLHQVCDECGYSDAQHRQLQATAAALQRVALVFVSSGWNGGAYTLTPLALRLQAELRDEGLTTTSVV